jgi:hypothetical protein
LPADVASHLHRTDKDVLGDPAIGYVIDRELLSLVVCDPAKYLGRTGLVPTEGSSAAGAPSGGLRVVGDDPSTLLFALGVRDGDVIKEVRKSVSSSSDLFDTLMDPSGDLGIVLERDHHRVSIALTATGRGSPKGVDEASRIHKLTETERRIERGLASELAASPARLACTIRLVPEPDGLRLFGVRQNSLLGVLGFENGDRVSAIAGVPVRTTRDAVRGMDAVGGASASFDVDLERRGKSLKFVYRLEP